MVKATAGGGVTALLVAALVQFGVTPVHAQAGTCGDRVVVAFGDSLAQIARRCGTTIPAIMAANPLLPNPNFVFPGMTLLLPRTAAPLPAPAPVPVQAARYIVRPGDTLSSIARANRLTLAQIYQLNPDIDARTLRVGDVVILPGGIVPPPAPPPAEAAVRYVVRAGDTVASIARASGTTRARILELNPNLDPRDLQAGDVIRLPVGAGPAPSPAGTRYVVRSGDTIASIARANDTTRAAILELNPRLNPRDLRIGDVVLLPRGSALPTPPPAPATQDVNLSTPSGLPGDVIEVTATGFQPSTSLKLLAGRNAAALREFQRVTTDRTGRATVSVRIPDWASREVSMVFGFETADGRLRRLAAPFQIEQVPPPPVDVSVIGTLTREGVTCQAMRGDDGQLYTLAGDVGRFRPGDRVRVDGPIAEISICQQGTTVEVGRIEAIR